jgi:cephalosporin hydroxylase
MLTLQEIYNQNEPCHPNLAGDKGTSHSYIDMYEKLFTPFRDKEVSFLEIGIAYGESLEMWNKFFHKAKIFGADISTIGIFSDEIKPGGYEHDKRFTIWIDDSTQLEFSDTIGDNKFDIIIDDGSHRMSDQVSTFKLLRQRMNPGGIYVIEDVVGIGSRAPFFMELHDNVEIMDLRETKNRFDDVLVVYRF